MTKPAGPTLHEEASGVKEIILSVADPTIKSGRLKDAIAVVTGGSAGNGKATCLRLAEAGATVVMTDWNGEDAEATADEVEARIGRETVSYEADVGDERGVEEMTDKLREGSDGSTSS